MNNKLCELTVIIVTFKTDKTILKNCLSSIDPKVKVIIVENSNQFQNKDEIENDFNNHLQCCSGVVFSPGSYLVIKRLEPGESPGWNLVILDIIKTKMFTPLSRAICDL